jgi:hypothetical protein
MRPGETQRIHDALEAITEACVLDLAPDRDDGYDLTDWLAEHPGDTEQLLDHAPKGVR